MTLSTISSTKNDSSIVEQGDLFDEESLANRPTPKKIPLTQSLKKELLKNLYNTQEKSLEDIAKTFGCTRQQIRNIMNQYGLKRRKRSKARLLAIKKNKFDRFQHDDINEYFFTIWSPGMAWVLGLLFTDGNVRRTGADLRITISSIDLGMLEKLRKLIGSTRRIRKNVQSYDKSKYIYEFQIFHEKLRDDLHQLGLIERKSLTMKFPEIPGDYLRHFIRGCWDGDGSVYISKDEKLNASYVCGSKDFMEKLIMELYKAGIHRIRLIRDSKTEVRFWSLSDYSFGTYPLALHKESRSKAYTIKLNSRNNLLTLFHYLYDGVPESMYLTRKYNMFVKGLSLSEKDLRRQREAPLEKSCKCILKSPVPDVKQTEINPEKRIEIAIRSSRTKVMPVNNEDGKLRCISCGASTPKMYITHNVYCPDCFGKSI